MRTIAMLSLLLLAGCSRQEDPGVAITAAQGRGFVCGMVYAARVMAKSLNADDMAGQYKAADSYNCEELIRLYDPERNPK